MGSRTKGAIIPAAFIHLHLFAKHHVFIQSIQLYNGPLNIEAVLNGLSSSLTNRRPKLWQICKLA